MSQLISWNSENGCLCLLMSSCENWFTEKKTCNVSKFVWVREICASTFFKPVETFMYVLFLTFATYFFFFIFVGYVKLLICVGRFLLSSSLYLISVCVYFIICANHTKFAPMTKWKWINKRSHGHKIKKIYDIVDPVLILFKIERAT